MRPTIAPPDAFWRAVNAFRLFTLVYAVVLYANAAPQYRRPWLGWVVMAVMAAWTLLCLRVPGPAAWVLAVDLVICAGSVLSTLVVDHPQRILDGAQTLPTVWSATAVLSWAISWGWRGGAVAAAVVAVADLVEVRGGLSLSTLDSIVLLFLAGSIVGYAVDLFRAGRRDLARAVAVEAATRERERLAVDIHDSVLQVLAYVRRRGLEVGGEAAEIGRLAGEQEARLRALVAAGPMASTAGGEQDVRALLTALVGAQVTVSAPAGAVLLPARTAHAVVGAVGAALDNVRRHAGDEAHAWVLVEEENDRVTVTVRDNGRGIEPGRLEHAEREGRLGVKAAIRARMGEVGGTVEVVSGPGQGTEVELHVPRSAVAARGRGSVNG